MHDGAGTHEATGEGVTELMIALPHGSSVTVQFNPNLVIEHPIIRCVLCVNALYAFRGVKDGVCCVYSRDCM